MELATAVAMDKAEAKKSATRYRQAFEENNEEALRQIAEGYEALSKGVALIDLPMVIRKGGVNEAGHPRLAVCRADARFCFLRAWKPWGQDRRTMQFAADDPNTEARANVVTVSDMDDRIANFVDRFSQLGAVVPLVPPEHRPRGTAGAWRGRLLHLRNFLVLWEVEEGGWQRRNVRRAYPRDPALLRHVGGDLYSVLAVWDLTDLERLVLGGRS